MTIKDICLIIDIICIAHERRVVSYIETVKYGRSFGSN